jgi:hypothetical protein
MTSVRVFSSANTAAFLFAGLARGSDESVELPRLVRLVLSGLVLFVLSHRSGGSITGIMKYSLLSVSDGGSCTASK